MEKHDTMMRSNEILKKFNISRSTLHRLSKRSDFPRKITISRRHVGWWESELYSFFDSLKG